MKCLIVDEMHTSLVQILKEGNVEVDYVPSITKAQILEGIESYHVLVLRSKIQVDEALITAACNLQVVARAGSGIDNMDAVSLEKKGIRILNAPEGNRDAVGDHTVGMLLALLKKLHLANVSVKSGMWEREAHRGLELKDKTVGVIGYGNMGSAFVERLQGFRCNVIAYDKYKKGFGNDHCTEVDIGDIFDRSDVVSLHIPLAKDTRGLVDESFVSRFRKDFFLINTARGEIAPLSVIVEGLKSGKIRGAALDVFECEEWESMTKLQRQSFNRLREFDNVVLSPHVAGWSEESYKRISDVLGAKILEHLGGITKLTNR